MNKKISIVLVLALLLIPVSAMAAGYQYRGGCNGCGSSGGSGSGAPLTAAEIQWLKFMREEEKLARDTYRFLYRTWGMQIFYGISNSEQRHTDAVKNLLIQYGVPDPALPTEGKFSNNTLQSLYNDLIDQGSVSKIEALEVGVLIEEIDINDLKNAINTTQHDNIKTVYSNLLQGSYNHLDAFNYQLSRY